MPSGVRQPVRMPVVPAESTIKIVPVKSTGRQGCNGPSGSFGTETNDVRTLRHTVTCSDNPSSRYHPPRFCLWTRKEPVPYNYSFALFTDLTRVWTTSSERRYVSPVN